MTDSDRSVIYAAIAIAVGLILAVGLTWDRPIPPLSPICEASK
jgi:hypothetical protein